MGDPRDEALRLILKELESLRADSTRARGWLDPRLIVTVVIALAGAFAVAVGSKAAIEERLQSIIERQSEIRIGLDENRREVQALSREVWEHRANLDIHRRRQP